MSFTDHLRRIRATPVDIGVSAAIVLLGVPMMIAGMVALGVYLYFFVFPPHVTIPEIKVATVARTSHIYAGDGSLLAALHAEHNREPIKLAKMPEHLRQAVVAAEDGRFYEHRGIDLHAIVRALSADIRAGGSVQGGSTITQQYVKNAFLGHRHTFFRKVREALVAQELEKKFSKDKILENYLNAVYFGRGAYGVEAAARTFFDKPASKLSVSESALLAGVIPSPSRFSPFDHPTDAEIRRRYVIDRMQKLRFIDPGQAEGARRNPPALAEAKPSEEVFKFPWFVDAVKRYLLSKYGEDKVFNGGLEVHATIDPAMQIAAEKTVKDFFPSPADPYGSIATVDPATGFVKAIVGGRDYEKEKFNIALQGHRQTGSAFKPFVLATALELGISPSDRFHGPSSFCGLKNYRSKDGCVHNFANEGFGNITVEQATIHSVNTVYIQIAQKIGVQRLIETSRRMGISKRSLEADSNNLAIALGGFTTGVTPLEMASGFATLAARGVYRAPKFVSKVVDTSGATLEKGPSKARRAISPQIADNVTAILEEVITKGTGRRADIGRPAAGKTGTAQDFRNAWFVGYTPQLSTAVWMGYKESNAQLLNIHGFKEVAGGTVPALMWSAYMRVVTEKYPPDAFPEPGPLQSLELPFRPSPEPLMTFSPEPTESPPDYVYSPSPESGESVEPSPSPSGKGILPGLIP